MWKQYLCGRLVFVILVAVYGSVLVIVVTVRRLQRVRSARAGTERPYRRIILTGTFYHDRWLRSHLVPLTRLSVEEIVVVCDKPGVSLPKVRYVCPPRWAARLMSRALAKLVWMVGTGVRYPAELFVGYHIFPSAISALLAAGLLGKASCYESTGGPIEVIGGGVGVENWFVSRLSRPSAYLESLTLRVVREFDCVVVRGRSARRYFVDRCRSDHVAVIPGSIDTLRFEPRGEARCFDLVFVGRLTEIKRPLLFVDVTAAVRRKVAQVRAAVVGDGPLLSEARRRAAQLGMEAHIEFLGKRDDVETILARSKLFVLTSRSEGLSIAMVEAMAAGAVPVVADVGELGDLVRGGTNGFVVEPDCTDAYAARCVMLLSDQDLRSRFSRAARESARQYHAVDVVAARWQQCLQEIVEPAAKPAA